MVTHHLKDGTTTNDITGHIIKGNGYVYKLVKEITDETKNKEQDFENNNRSSRDIGISVNSES